MEKLILGSGVSDSRSASGKTRFCEFSFVVKKGHSECGDSAFVYCDERKLIAAVLDGVSGDPGAALASSDAANAILDSLKGEETIDQKKLEDAFTKGHCAIRLGSTTVSLLFLKNDGSFVIAGIGDSPIFSIDEKEQISLELPMARIVGDDDSILKFLYFRNMVTSVLGSIGEIKINIRSGKLKEGETFIIASDGLSDNLFFEVENGYVKDCSGITDLKAILSGKKPAKAITKALIDEIEKRLQKGKIEEKNRLLVPKDDDISIIAIRRI